MTIKFKTLLEYTRNIFEQINDRHIVFAFGRMNPPTIGHEVLVNRVLNTAKKNKADHEIVLSHSHDPEKNPLTPEKKLKHAKRFFPEANLSTSSRESPTLIHHLTRLHKAGYTHLTMVADHDRTEEFKKLLNRYNGKPDKKGNIPFNFKEINFVLSGERDPDAEGASGMSASKMRKHAENNDFNEFKKGVPSHVSDEHAKELFSDVKQGMKS